MFSFYNVLTPEKKLPIYQPSMVKFQLVDSTIQHVKRFHKIDDFELVNQNNDTVTNEIYDGKIYVADFFFTTCPGICPIMKENMVDIQEEFLNDDQILLLSHTVTPEIDDLLLEAQKTYQSIDDVIKGLGVPPMVGILEIMFKGTMIKKKDYEIDEIEDMVNDLIKRTPSIIDEPTTIEFEGRCYKGTNSDLMKKWIKRLWI